MSEISAERTYYVRTSLMYSDMTREVLFKLFRFLIDTEDIAGFLSSPYQQTKLFELRRKNVLNKTDYNLVSGHVLNPERFDISLLIRLISNLCKDKIIQPKGVRISKPQPKDESLGADLYRLRDVRNKIIGHRSDASLSESEYEHTWEKVKAILLRVVQHVARDNSEDFEQRLDGYKLLNIDTEDSRVKKLMAELLDYQRETESLQEKVEELTASLNELQVYLKTTPEQFVRYIKLLFEGGRIVLCGILERVLGDQILADLLENHRNTLEDYIDEVFYGCLFPKEPTTIDHRAWDIYLLALVLLLVFKDDISRIEVKYIECIKEARLGYANCALSSLDTNKFLSKWTDLVNSLNRLSINIPEEDEQQVEYLIEVYKEKDEEGGNAEEYFEQLKKSGVEVKPLKDVHKETKERLEHILSELNEKGVQFKEAHVLEMKMLTTCENEEIRKKAEDLLEINLQASLQGLPHDIEPIRIETDKLVASVAAHSDVKSGDVTRSCIIWSFKCSTPCGLLHILDYFDSDQFRCTLQNIARELYYMYGYVFLLQGHFTLESLSRYPMLKGSTEETTSEHISIPLKCTSVEGIKSVLSELKQERTTNILNKIAEQISAEVKETVSIKVFPDIMEFQDVIDDTESEGSTSFGQNEEEDVVMVSDEMDQRHQISFQSKQGDFESNDKIAQYEDTEMYRKLSLEDKDAKLANVCERKHVEVVMGNESTCNSGTARMNIETSTGTFPSIDMRKEPTNEELKFGGQNLHKYKLDDAVLMQENEFHGKYVPEDTKKTGWNYDSKEMLTTKGIDEKDERNIEKYDFSTESERLSSSRKYEEEDQVLISDEIDQIHQKSSSSYEVDNNHAERENVESSDKRVYKHEDNEAYKKQSHGHEEIATTNVFTRKQFEDEVGNESTDDSEATGMSKEINTTTFPSIDIRKMLSKKSLYKKEESVEKYDFSTVNELDNDHAERENVESSEIRAYEHEYNKAYKKISHGHEEIKMKNTRKQFEDIVGNESTCDSGATKLNMEPNTSILPSYDVGKDVKRKEEKARRNEEREKIKKELMDNNLAGKWSERGAQVLSDFGQAGTAVGAIRGGLWELWQKEQNSYSAGYDVKFGYSIDTSDLLQNKDFLTWTKGPAALDAMKKALCGHVQYVLVQYLETFSDDEIYHLEQFIEELNYGYAVVEKKKWKMRCKHYLCESMLEKLLQIRHNKRSLKIVWKTNCLVNKRTTMLRRREICETYYWTIANMFMFYGGEQNVTPNSSPADTDVALVLRMLKTCTLFEVDKMEIYDMVICIQNRLFHTGQYNMTEEIMKDMIETMIELLEQVQNLPNCKSEHKKEITHGIKELEQINRRDLITISVKSDAEWKTMAVRALELQREAIEFDINAKNTMFDTTALRGIMKDTTLRIQEYTDSPEWMDNNLAGKWSEEAAHGLREFGPVVRAVGAVGGGALGTVVEGTKKLFSWLP